jgi:hypothetical protein
MQKEDVHELLREHGYSEDASLDWQAFHELLCAKVTERTPQVRASNCSSNQYSSLNVQIGCCAVCVHCFTTCRNVAASAVSDTCSDAYSASQAMPTAASTLRCCRCC